MGHSLHGEPPAAGGVKPPEANQPVRTDHYGDPLPKGVRFRLGTVRLRHDAMALAWSLDGRTLVSAGEDDTVRQWQIPGGKQLAKWDKMDFAVFSPDGRTLACGGSKGPIRICDLATGKELRRVNVPKAEVYPYAFSPDGKTLAAIQFEGERGVRLYAVDSGKEVRFLKGEVPHWIHVLAFSPDGQTLAVVRRGGGLCCWQTATGKKLKTLESNEAFSEAYSAAFSPDGKLLAAAIGDGANVTYRLWSWPAGEELRRLDPKDNIPVALAFSLDGKVLATGGSSSIRLWDPTTGQEQCRFEGHHAQVMDLAFSPDGSLLASAGADGVVTVWELRKKNAPRPLTGVGYRLTAFTLTANGRLLLTSARDGKLAVWDARTGQHLRTLASWRHVADTLAVAPDGRTAIALSNYGESSSRWELRTGRQLPPFSGIDTRIIRLVYSPDAKKLALGTIDGVVHLRSTTSDKECRRLEGEAQGRAIHALAWADDGRTLAVSYYGGDIGLWEPSTGQRFHRIPTLPREHAETIAFSPDGRLLAAAWKTRGIRLYEVVSGQEIRCFGSGRIPIRALAFAPDSRTLAAGVWRGRFRFDEGFVPLPDGEEKFAIQLWDVPGRKQLRLLRGHQDEVHTLAFSPDGVSLISGSDDDTVLAWDVADVTCRRPTGKELSADKLPYLWTDLASKDAARAQRAVADLIQAPDSALPYLAKALPPLPPVRRDHITALIADLDHEQFARRERASGELEKVGEPAAPALRKALKEKSSLEMRRRITALLEAIDAQTASPEWLRTVRALQALESIGTPKASQILEGLTRGAPEARLTEEAKASLQRLRRRSAKP